MRNIQKQAEPKSLTQHRCNTSANYDNYDKKDDLRDSLVSEQRGICCYCMQRIRPNLESMKIEHWQSQSPNKFPKKQLDYGNLLGACLGEHGQSKKNQHCDTRKGDDDILFNPANPSHDVERFFKLPATGLIQSDDPQIQKQISDEISDDIDDPKIKHYSSLNLNHPKLVNNRKAVIDAFIQVLQKEQVRDSDLTKHLADWEGKNGGQLRPFCQVIVYYLRKKVNRMPPKTIK